MQGKEEQAGDAAGIGRLTWRIMIRGGMGAETPAYAWGRRRAEWKARRMLRRHLRTRTPEQIIITAKDL